MSKQSIAKIDDVLSDLSGIRDVAGQNKPRDTEQYKGVDARKKRRGMMVSEMSDKIKDHGGKTQ